MKRYVVVLVGYWDYDAGVVTRSILVDAEDPLAAKLRATEQMSQPGEDMHGWSPDCYDVVAAFEQGRGDDWGILP